MQRVTLQRILRTVRKMSTETTQSSIISSDLSFLAKKCEYFDIGVNLVDPMYQGVYNGKKYHECDIPSVLARAVAQGCTRMLLTGSSISESVATAAMAEQYSSPQLQLMYTVGVHPCCVNGFVIEEDSTIDKVAHIEYTPELLVETRETARRKLLQLYQLWEQQLELSKKNTGKAVFKSIGEFGLDHDRLHYAAWELQTWFFEQQLKLACLFTARHPAVNIPLFLHQRNCCPAFAQILQKYIAGCTDTEDFYGFAGEPLLGVSPAAASRVEYKFPEDQKYVVHSYTDGPAHLATLLSLSKNMYIGLNGCSLREESGLDTVRQLPLDRVLVETDAPWCEIKNSSAVAHLVTQKQVLEQHTRGASSVFCTVKRDKVSARLAQGVPQKEIMVKGRNEPCNVYQVVQAIAKLKDTTHTHVAQQVWENSLKVYAE